MPSRSPYADAVARNMEHLGTMVGEWSACPFVMMTDDAGRVTPHVSYPDGYDRAPTLFPQSVGGNLATCELCGHGIRNCYGVQHDGRRWLLVVGSDCVERFVGTSGEALAAAEREAYALQFAQYLHSTWHAVKALRGTLATEVVHGGCLTLLRRLDRTVYLSPYQPLRALEAKRPAAAWLAQNQQRATKLTTYINAKLGLEVAEWHWPDGGQAMTGVGLYAASTR